MNTYENYYIFITYVSEYSNWSLECLGFLYFFFLLHAEINTCTCI